MKRVAILATADMPRDQYWDAAASDLAVKVVRQLPTDVAIESLFVAAPASVFMDGQSNQAAIFADRLGLTGDVAVFQLEAGNASGAAALHAAYAHIRSGLARTALVLGVSKVSDCAESERTEILDGLIDQEVEGSLGLTYMAMSGLLADLYLETHGIKKSAFAQVVAKNAHNGFLGGDTFLKYAPTADEISRDISTAAPLVRSDFAPLLDGATAILLVDYDLARESSAHPVEILSIASSTDLSVQADRERLLEFKAVARSSTQALKRAGDLKVADLEFVEIDNPCSVVEILSLESAGITEAGSTLPMYAKGYGKVDSALCVNPSGGQQARGLALGTAGLDHAHEAFVQLTGNAGKRQVKSKHESSQKRAMSIAVFGLGTQAFTTIYGVNGDDNS